MANNLKAHKTGVLVGAGVLFGFGALLLYETLTKEDAPPNPLPPPRSSYDDPPWPELPKPEIIQV